MPVVMVSGVELLLEKRAGFDAYVVKPFSIAGLLQVNSTSLALKIVARDRFIIQCLA